MSDDAFVARLSMWRLLIAMTGCAGFVAFGVFVLSHPESFSTKPAAPFVGWLTVIVFSVFMAFGMIRLLGEKEQLRISPKGICWVLWRDGVIPWQEVAEVAVETYRANFLYTARYIAIRLTNPARYRPTKMFGRLGRLVPRFAAYDLVISLGGTDGNFDDALDAIERFGRLSVVGRGR